MALEHLGPELAALFSVIVIDVVLAGDNAMVVAVVASRLDVSLQRQVIALGIGVAFLCRVVFAVVASRLLLITGLLFGGGLLLLWVAWKLWRELRFAGGLGEGGASVAPGDPPSFRAAVFQVAAADISMSLDNVLGVAGAAQNHLWMLVFGLVLSITLMGVAASVIARYMQRHRWLSYLGLAIVAYVAISMIVRGAGDVLAAAGP